MSLDLPTALSGPIETGIYLFALSHLGPRRAGRSLNQSILFFLCFLRSRLFKSVFIRPAPAGSMVKFLRWEGQGKGSPLIHVSINPSIHSLFKFSRCSEFLLS